MQSSAPSSATLWAGRLFSGLPALFLLVDGVMKLLKPAPVVAATTKLGIPAHLIVPLGITLTLCTIIYAVPRTAMLGAILLTGYLGGAVNTHVRAGEGWFSILLPVFFGALLWGGLYWRELRLHTLVPVTSPAVASSKKMFWAGCVLSVLPALLLFFSAYMKLSKNPQAVDGFKNLGYADSAVLGIGWIEVLCTVLYLVPRTAVLGAILLTGYMGGAIVTHLRVGEPFLAQFLIGVVLWAALCLRDERLRALIPSRR